MFVETRMGSDVLLPNHDLGAITPVLIASFAGQILDADSPVCHKYGN